MLKILMISTQLIGLFFLNYIYTPREVELVHDLPKTAIIGSEHWVYVHLDKGKVGGFAKYQVDVPKGMQVEPGDLRGASFTFSEGSAKIIWMSLPPENEFDISFKLIIYDDCQTGNNIIRQKFAYLEKNERKVLQVPDHVIFIESENLSNAYVPDTLANGTRTVTRLNDDHYLIELDIYKDGIKGFAKVEELIPEGMSAEAVNKAKSVFTQIDNKVKFVWFSIPEEEKIVLTYELFSEGPIDESILVEGTLPINGEFTYLRNNESRTIPLHMDLNPPITEYVGEYKEPDPTVAEITPDPIVEEITPDPIVEDITPDPIVEEITPDPIVEEITPDPIVEEITPDPIVEEITPDPIVEEITPDPIVEEITPDPIVEEITPDPIVEEITPDPIKEETTVAIAETTEVVIDKEIDNFQDVTSVPSPEKGVSYRVQIMAGKNLVDATYLKKRHKFIDTFTIENHKSWIKYTTGRFNMYKEARDKRNHITDNYNFDGPFVTAYSEGVRITVQEALMITRQKWYQ